MATHKAEVRALGMQLVDAEGQLDKGFANHSLDSAQLSELVKRIGDLQTAIRASHLQTHLTQTALLSREQIDRYNTLRGYKTGDVSSHKH